MDVSVDVINFERGGREDNICLTYVIRILLFMTILLVRTRCLVRKTRFVVKLMVVVKPRFWVTYLLKPPAVHILHLYLYIIINT